MDAFYVLTMQAAIAAACWLIVAMGTGYAVFSPSVEDTFCERIALSCVCITSLGTAWRVVKSGEISDGGMLLAGALAWYVLSIVWKHLHNTSGEATDKKGAPA